ncbi:MAG: sugar phosphate isomerase/epimerase [Oscillospiraceae bacterium]
MRLAAHAVLFTEKIVSETDEILNNFSEMGYEGIEIGARFFPQEKMAVLKQKLEDNKMELSGMHALLFFDEILKDFESAKNKLLLLSFELKKNGFKRIIASGIPDSKGMQNNQHSLSIYKAEELKLIGERIDQLAHELLDKNGIQLFYHNHNWEFEQGESFLFDLLKEAKYLKFAMDLGWVSVEGYKPEDLLAEYPDKFGYLHLRDCDMNLYSNQSLSFQEKWESFLDVGEGTVNFDRIIDAFQKTTVDDEKWIVIEYEKGEVDFSRYQKAYAVIKPLMEKIGVS